MPQIIPAYVINLDRRPDRWETISANLDRIGVKAERIPAVDARTLEQQEEWERETNHNKPLYGANLGSVANMLSQSKAMDRFLQTTAPACLILEDDAELADDTAGLLLEIDWWPAGSEIVRLEQAEPVGRKWGQSPPLWSRPCGRTPNGRAIHRIERGYGGSTAYIVNRAGAARAIRVFAKPRDNTDQILFNLRTSPTARALRPHQIVPAMARQRGGRAGQDSDIGAYYDAAYAAHSAAARRRRRWAGMPHMARARLLIALGLVRRVKVEYTPS